MKKTGIVILTIALIAAICGSFYVVNDKSKRANQKEKVLTEVQRITTKDLDKNYPQTPREVVKLYNRIVKCYYGMQYSDEELDALTDQALKLFDDELAANNPKDTYKQSVTADAQSYKDQGITLAQTGVCDSNDVKYVTDNGSKISYVKASYFMKEGSSYSKTYQEYVLRQDKEGCWRILTFYKIAADSDTETE